MANTQTGTFDDPEDLLDQFRTFIIAQTDCTELYYAVEGDGQRFHFTKTTGTETYYFNFRAMVNETVVGNPFTADFYGLLMNASTSFDSADNALEQDGAPPYQNSAPTGGQVMLSASTGKDYRFCADADFFSITVEGYDDIQQHIIGLTSNNMYGNVCSGSFHYQSGDPTSDYNYGFRRLLSTPYAVINYGCAILVDGTTWYTGFLIAPTSSLKMTFDLQAGLVGPDVLDNSVNTNLGKPVLLPFTLDYGTDTLLTQADGVSNIAFLNKKYINNGEIVLIGGASWVVYEANYSAPDYGIAFKTS